MRVYKYMRWNAFTEDVIANSRIYFPSRRELNDPAELVHPCAFEQGRWNKTEADARDKIEPATRIRMLDLAEWFNRMSASEDEDPRVSADPAFAVVRQHSRGADTFPGLLELHYERTEDVHQAIQFYTLTLAEDRRLLYRDQERTVAALNRKLDAMGILSMSSRKDCPVMWAHYAANHTGLVLVFDTSKDTRLSKARRVSYVSSRPTLNPSTVVDALYAKARAWEREREIRVVEKTGGRTVDFDPRALVGIVLGADMSDGVIQTVVSRVRGRPSPCRLLRAVVDPNGYGIRSRPVLDVHAEGS